MPTLALRHRFAACSFDGYRAAVGRARSRFNSEWRRLSWFVRTSRALRPLVKRRGAGWRAIVCLTGEALLDRLVRCVMRSRRTYQSSGSREGSGPGLVRVRYLREIGTPKIRVDFERRLHIL